MCENTLHDKVLVVIEKNGGGKTCMSCLFTSCNSWIKTLNIKFIKKDEL